jgi:hypothetical protein
LWVNTGTVVVVNTTFVDNQPDGLNVDGGGTITNATFANSGWNGDYEFYNSLFVDMDCDAPAQGDHNLQWPEGGACAGGTSFADPELGPLADNGGATPTLLPGNAAAVSGVGVDCPGADQRGEPRAIASCAAGAVEP